MSLTNDQITAKNFKEFYEAIRPYLNGSFPTAIANKFDKANMYSTDEQIVGRWIDGKPLYQKTMVKTYNDDFPTGDATIVLGDDDLSNADWVEVKTFYGLLKSGNYIDLWAMNYYLGNANYQISKFTSAIINANIGNKLTIYAPSVGGYYKSDATYGVTKTFATIQYTKTTDTAMDIGSDTDYSTTEKIIGTWIDGKPLYQKTYTIQKLVQNPGELTLSHGLTNYTVVGVDSTFVGTSDVKSQVLPNAWVSADGGSSVAMSQVTIRETDILVRIKNGELAELGNIYVTLRYTKTTD